MNQKDLELLVEELKALPKESEWIEFKVNKAIPENIGEYISGLSNAACLEGKDHAYLVFGLANKTHEVIGTSFYPQHKTINNEEIENWLATLLEPRIDFKIFDFTYKAKHLVIFRIDPTLNTPVKFKGIAYIRVGSYLKKLKDHPEKERKIWQKVRNVVYEKEYAKRNINTDAVLELLDYPQVFRLLKIPLPSNKEAIVDKLYQEKLIDIRFSRYHITNLGAILFANNLKDFEGFERKGTRIIIYKGKDRTTTIKEQVIYKGYAVGFKEIVDYVNDKLPSNEEIGKVFRKEIKIFPELAVRELIANAIIHQDFNISGTSPMIEIFNNRIEITNPGKPLISTNRFIDHSPISRNELLASIMRRIGICEERGSGVDKTIIQIEIFQLPAPEFIAGDNYTRVVLYSPKTLRQMSKPDKIRACYQHCCLKYVSGELMTNQSLRERFDIDDKAYPIVSRIIRETIDADMIYEYEKARMYVPFWV